MKKGAGILILAGMVLIGCSSGEMEKKTLYLNTEMQSPVSRIAQITVPADTLIKENGVRHIILYSLRPTPGATFNDDLERKYTAANMYINLSPGKKSRTAQISGEINYYDTERYVNAKLVGDIVKSIPVPEKTINLTLDKPMVIELPRGMHFSVELSESPDTQQGK
ncbi:hypothetical protein [Rahnella sp. WP5]|uniref:hypothetical protein n=1 Tax=Rahnella sp. WP5 TaxID=1500266 RepID=UPI00055C7489|nr:hypothetical protein [Rahnella sp. WP5]